MLINNRLSANIIYYFYIVLTKKYTKLSHFLSCLSKIKLFKLKFIATKKNIII